ncbi:hypothetical protein LR48_Vigan09g098600 [Vigna angularis]|uniref:Uncharacterized protein n=2 Tax=Phaseolus angularis TaxID=3914 RepID=A0A0L9VBL1_PHAAN|nr:hypothetical protein LR48_Vigan09g098600 [Vigna angularis]
MIVHPWWKHENTATNCNMGNILSYKWSSVEFSRESSLIYTPLFDKSKLSIFRLSVSSERVLIRLADSLCDDHPVRSLYVEITAERNNNNKGCFNFGVVRVVEDGACGQTVRDTEQFTNLCGKKSCFYGVMRKSGSGNLNSEEKKVTWWEVVHSYKVTLTSHVRYSVMIKCDEVRGLCAEFIGPFKCEGQVSREGLLKQCSADSLVRLSDVKGKPPKALNAFVESGFTGKEYILFKPEEKARRVKIINTDANFNGSGNGSEYRNCNIIMKYEAKGTN